MTYRVEFASAAARQVRKLPRRIQILVLDAATSLVGATPPRIEEAQRRGDRVRIRIGDYRIIYDVYDSLLIITVVRVAHRRQAYRK